MSYDKSFTINLINAIEGTARNDTINGTAGNDVIEGLAGNDLINGGDGDDTYIWNRGDGNYTISEDFYGGANDKLVLTGVKASQISFSRTGNNVSLIIAPSAPGKTDGGTVTLLNLSVDEQRGVESIVLADATWNLQDVRNFALAAANNKGKTAFGFNGDDTYIWNRGDGNYTISEDYYGGANDKLVLTGVKASQISFSRTGNDVSLIIAPSAPGKTDGGTVTLLNLSVDEQRGVESIVLADATWNLQQIRNFVLAAAANKGKTVFGFNGDDTYIWNRGDGNYTISEDYYGGANDKLVLTGVKASQISFSRTGNDVSLIIAPSAPGKTDGGTVTLLNLSVDEQRGVESIVLADATWNLQDVRNFALAAAANKGKTVFGFNGDDTYIWNRGDGNYTISEDYYGGANDKLVLTGVKASQISFSRTGNDVSLIIAPSAPGKTDGGTVTLLNLSVDEQRGVESIVLADATWNLQQIRNFALAAAANKGKTVFGFNGDDTYIWNRGDGNYTISEDYYGGANDKLVLTGVKASQISFSRTGNDVSLIIAPSAPGKTDGGTVTLLNLSVDEQRGVESIVLADATWNLQQIRNFVLAAAANKGKTVFGFNSDDTYIWNRGDGNYTISEDYYGGANDKLVLTGVKASQISFSRTGNNVSLIIAPSAPGKTDGGTVTLLNLSVDEQRGVESIVLADATWNLQDVRNFALAAAANKGKTVFGFNGDDTYIWNRGDGNYTISEDYYGGANDKLVLTGVKASQISFSRTGNDVSLIIAPSAPGKTDGGTVTLLNLSVDEQRGVESIVLADATWNLQQIRNFVLAAAANKGKTVFGFNSDDTYIWNRGDGNYTISEDYYGGANDKLVLTGVKASQISFSRTGNNVSLIIAPSAPGKTDGGTVTLLNLSVDEQRGVESIVLADATWNLQQIRNFALAAAANKGKTVFGFNGDDTYIWNRGDGNYTISEDYYGGANDKLVLTGVKASQISFSRTGNRREPDHCSIRAGQD